MLDLAITGATVVDGTGAQARRADIGISGGTIVEIAEPGTLSDGATRTLAAEGRTVIPGVIDVHTHYDAQLHWDPVCSPSPMHGVTTVISGNCGLTLAPAAPEDREFLTRLLARVEAIPIEALEAGLEFRWSSYPELIDHMASSGYGVNIGLMVGHSAVRRAVMGNAASERGARDDEITAMQQVLSAAIAAGGFGLSTATPPTQVDGDGRPTPPTFAAAGEFLALAQTVGEHPGTCLEFIPGSYLRGFSDDDVRLLAGMSATANRHLNWNLVLVNKEDPDLHHRQMAVTDRARELGGRVVPLAMPHNGQLQQDFYNGYVFRALPGWGDLFALEPVARAKALGDTDTRARLAASLEAETSGLAVTMRRAWPRFVVNEVHDEGLTPLVGRSIEDIAAERGISAFDAILDVAIAGELRVGFVRSAYADDDPWIRAARAEVVRDPRVVLGASDAGAHMDMMVGGDYPTRANEALVRDQGVFTLEELVHRLTDVQARLYGLIGRGRIATGYVADLVVIDPDMVGATPMRTVTDLPAGASRLISDSTGVDAVFVAGRQVVRDGAYTGDLPGRVLRSGADTATVTAR